MNKSNSKNAKQDSFNDGPKRKQLYYAIGLILLWIMVFLAIHFHVIKT